MDYNEFYEYHIKIREVSGKFADYTIKNYSWNYHYAIKYDSFGYLQDEEVRIYFNDVCDEWGFEIDVPLSVLFDESKWEDLIEAFRFEHDELTLGDD